MKTIYTSLLTVIAFLGLTSLSNCTRDNDCPETDEKTINLTQDELSKVPYTGYDTLYFLNKRGDTCIVRGTGKQFFYENEVDIGRGECPPPISTDYQAYKIQFVSIKGGLNFKLGTQSSKGAITLSDNASSAVYYFELWRLNDTSRFYGGGVFIGGFYTSDTCYASTYHLKLGVTYIKDCKLNNEYKLIN